MSAQPNISEKFFSLRVVHCKKKANAKKKRINVYPFGLQHKGYNNVVSANGNSTAEKFKYQGQELEEELGKNTYAYQWRDYDPAIGRFNKIDRFAEKYDPVSPYSFTANNPIVFKDIKGDSLSITSKDRKHIDTTVDVVNNGLGGYYEFKVDEDGNASISKTGKKGKATKQQKKLFKTLNKAIKNEETTSIEIVNNDSNVEIGSFDTGQIDIGDVQKLGDSNLENPEFISSQGAIAHEVEEQFSKQVGGQTDVFKAHKQGLKAEMGVNGTTGVRQDVGAFAIKNSAGKTISNASTLQSNVQVGTSRKTIDIIVINGNVRGVRKTKQK
jgi:RHS repeat-associated protein